MEFLSPKNKFCVIKTFNDVKLGNMSKPLVICDIDHTFIRCFHGLDHFRNIVNNEYKGLPDLVKQNFMRNSEVEAIELMNNAYNLGFIKQTDPDGFNTMLKNIERLGGKLIFLTARGIVSHQKTINDLKRAGLSNPEDFDIHYTNNQISKGEYIKKSNLVDGYQHISFIDDHPSFLTSVRSLFPNINCYMFAYD